MTRAEFENKSFEELIEHFMGQGYNIASYEDLKELAKYLIEEDNLLFAIHILEAIQKDEANWYSYDYSMGTLETPTSIRNKEDLEDYIED